MDINTCIATTAEVRSLSLYAHVAPALASLTLGWFAFRYAQVRSKAVLFFSFTILFAVWLLADLFVWNTNNYYAVSAVWSTLDYINVLFFLLLSWFIYIDFTKNRIFSYGVLGVSLLVLLPPLLLTLAGMAVTDFDQAVCELGNNQLMSNYKLAFEWSVMGVIILLAAWRLAHIWTVRTERNRVFLITTSIVLFMGMFSGTEYVATLTDFYEINLYALFILPVFILILAYAVVEQGTFKISTRTLSFVHLLFVLFIIIGISDLFLTENATQLIVSGVSTAITLAFSLLLLRGATREAEQREEIQKLAQDLEHANERLRKLDQAKSEFVSIASHQLRSPLTSIRGYASMLLEGSYGKLTKKATLAISRIHESARFMALTVEDFLNVSRIEAGTMKYEISEFDICSLVTTVYEDMKPSIAERNLEFILTTEINGPCQVRADIGKVRQIIQNVVDNATKYTKQGAITVTLNTVRNSRCIEIEVTDTGIGMSAETIRSLFQKFTRAANANSVNVIGSGLGLYVARQMAEKMGGTVTAASAGEGKGSTFTITLPRASAAPI